MMNWARLLTSSTQFLSILTHSTKFEGEPEVTRDLINVMREDVVEPSLSREEVLRNAGAQEDGFIKAPRVM